MNRRLRPQPRLSPISFMTRRRILGLLGLTVLGGCTSTSVSGPDASAGQPDASGTGTGRDASGGGTGSDACLTVTETTRGPYFADDRADPYISGDFVDAGIPERSDIRADTEGSAGVQPGLPLVLTITVGDASCAPVANAQVHIWHCNAQGVYSDFTANTNDGGASHTGQDFLRGYQYTDAGGEVTFTTIYPGWYRGRTVHIHVKVRVFDASGAVTTESTTQLLFDDALSDQVFAEVAAYAKGTARDQTNATDGIASSEHPTLLVATTGSTSTSLSGAVALAITLGQIHGG